VSRRQPPSRGRAASFFFVLGCLAVLGVVFLLGLVTGRHWPGLLPSARAGSAAAREPQPSRRAESRPGEPKPAADPAPGLTFYRELTAPLSPSVPPPRPRLAPAPSASHEAGAPAPRYTVQVGAFGTRAQADAVHDRLVAAGYDVYVDEVEGVRSRWRVRVGDFPSRAQARQAAQRLGAERQLATYVTVR
jgi:cell division protein FtsN